MLKLQQNIYAPNMVMYTHENCGNSQYITQPRKYCVWCSGFMVDVKKLLKSMEHRIEYNKEGKVDNVKP